MASITFPLADLEPGAARRIDVGGVHVAVVRIDDEVYAIGDTCSHAKVSLADGEVWAAERELECPQHASTFDLRTGTPTCLPATQSVPVYEAVVCDGAVTITVEATR